MIKVILYTSNTGSTERYAKMLGEKTGLPVYNLKDSDVPSGTEILYMGWVMASSVKGYKKRPVNIRSKQSAAFVWQRSGPRLPNSEN